MMTPLARWTVAAATAVFAATAAPAKLRSCKSWARPFPVGAQPYGVLTADFNRDGRPDVMGINGTGSTGHDDPAPPDRWLRHRGLDPRRRRGQLRRGRRLQSRWLARRRRHGLQGRRRSRGAAAQPGRRVRQGRRVDEQGAQLARRRRGGRLQRRRPDGPGRGPLRGQRADDPAAAGRRQVRRGGQPAGDRQQTALHRRSRLQRGHAPRSRR